MPTTSPSGQAVTPICDLWLPVTVQVAWTLVKRRYTVTPELLADAREHLLRSVDRSLTVDQIEWLTPAWVDHYLARRVHKKMLPAPEPGPEVRIPAHRWKEALLEGADSAALAVFRGIYAEGMSPERAAQRFGWSVAPLETTRDRLRDRMREVAATGNAAFRTADASTIDTFLRRLAALASPDAPGPMGLTSPRGLAEAENCPRCSRAIRLLRKGHLKPQSLFPPDGDQDPSAGTVTIICLLLHPEARKHARTLERRLGEQAIPAGKGAWLLPVDAESHLYETLVDLCGRGSPARHHVRATRTEGSGRWSRQTLLGPVAGSATDAARAVAWGDICGRPALPLPAPPPPSASRWWAGALVATAATVALGIAVAQPEAARSPTPIDARFLMAQGGWDVSFDLPDRAVLDVVVVEDGAIRILHRSIESARGAWSTGYGGFRARIPGQQVALLASRRGIVDLERLVLDASLHPEPLAALEQLVEKAHPRADIARTRSPVASAEVAAPIVAPL